MKSFAAAFVLAATLAGPAHAKIGQPDARQEANRCVLIQSEIAGSNESGFTLNGPKFKEIVNTCTQEFGAAPTVAKKLLPLPPFQPSSL